VNLIRFLGCAFVVLAVGALPTLAEAACVSAAAALPAAAVDGARANPAGLLTRFPNGEGAMASEIRNLVTTDPSLVDSMLSLVANANADQRRAIGAGLGQAASICTRPEPQIARQIQESLLKLANPDVVLAFQAVVGDQTAAVGGGAGAGPGGVGGSGTNASGAGTTGGTGSLSPASVSFTNPAFSSGTGAGKQPTQTGTTGTNTSSTTTSTQTFVFTTISSSVSP
jgi:hypothetical protein